MLQIASCTIYWVIVGLFACFPELAVQEIDILINMSQSVSHVEQSLSCNVLDRVFPVYAGTLYILLTIEDILLQRLKKNLTSLSLNIIPNKLVNT